MGRRLAAEKSSVADVLSVGQAFENTNAEPAAPAKSHEGELAAVGQLAQRPR